MNIPESPGDPGGPGGPGLPGGPGIATELEPASKSAKSVSDKLSVFQDRIFLFWVEYPFDSSSVLQYNASDSLTCINHSSRCTDLTCEHFHND